MSPTTVPTAAAAHENECRIIPMFVCAGCRPEPLGYALIDLGDGLEEVVVCPMREVCAWHAAHDLGGRCQFNEMPEAAIMVPEFRAQPYFSCPNFHDHAKFLAAADGDRRQKAVPVSSGVSAFSKRAEPSL